ncbi:MAG: PEP-CTERM sorting domain-containing protein [Verrucomicrobiales bacterium]|nr:PEP-CTERM sorting domain-containing protein [Verrucomicrobiales bacterium]
MNESKIVRLIGSVLISVPSLGAVGSTVPVDLSSWSVVQYELFDQPDARWSLSAGNTVATQSVNADASILLSDFSVSGLLINGKWRVDTTSDDDFMGFVFGYQDRGDFYLFDWKQGNQNDPLGFAEQGMSLKVVKTGGTDPTGVDLWRSAGSSDVTVLRHNTIPWNEFTEYEFTLNFDGSGSFSITVREGATELENWVVDDSAFLGGKFGFYNYSQGDVVYSGFTTRDDPPPVKPVPESSTLVSIGALGFVILSSRIRRRLAANS